MGGDLPAAGEGKNPKFTLLALQDTGSEKLEGTPLQRAQILKGWYEDGELKEQVLDVAGGDNGASVDLATCQRQGEGHQSLCTVWEDQDFNPESQAFYYARVLENPTCRWSQYYCIAAEVNCAAPETIPEGMEGCCSDSHQPAIQERAWSSPIWYTPAK